MQHWQPIDQLDINHAHGNYFTYCCSFTGITSKMGFKRRRNLLYLSVVSVAWPIKCHSHLLSRKPGVIVTILIEMHSLSTESVHLSWQTKWYLKAIWFVSTGRVLLDAVTDVGETPLDLATSEDMKLILETTNKSDKMPAATPSKKSSQDSQGWHIL